MEINSFEYQLIKDAYKDIKTKRSKVALINHINEGLVILELLGATDTIKNAFCLHPLVQSDENLLDFIKTEDCINCDPLAMIYAMEYRKVANSYLSNHYTGPKDKIDLGPLHGVKLMLIADKVQNCKDFMFYHRDTHPRSDTLEGYFRVWLNVLGIDEKYYNYLTESLY